MLLIWYCYGVSAVQPSGSSGGGGPIDRFDVEPPYKPREIIADDDDLLLMLHQR